MSSALPEPEAATQSASAVAGEPVTLEAPEPQSSPPPPTISDVDQFKRASPAASPASVAVQPPAAVAPSAPPPMDKVPFRDLFQFATSEEIWLMRFSCLCAAGLGLVFPLFSILFGDLLNSLNGTRSLSDIASDFSLKFLIIAICAGFGGAVSYGLPVYVAERQMKRVRELYLSCILRQEPAWFDVNKPGEVSSRLAEDTLTWQNGIADKFTQVFANTVGFCASIIIGFNSNWRIALAVLAIFPAIMVIMIFLKVAISTGEKRASDAYAAAGDCSTEIFNSIRTVAAFCAEAAETKKYVNCLVKARDASKSKGWSMGIAVGSLFFCIYAAYAGGMYGPTAGGLLPFRRVMCCSRYLGGYLIRQDRLDHIECDPYAPANAALGRAFVLPSTCVTGGSIIQTFMVRPSSFQRFTLQLPNVCACQVVLTGAFLIGGAAPNFGTIASAQAAAFKIIEIIKRSPPIDVNSNEGLMPGRDGVPPLQGRIEFKNVRFSYPSRPDTLILDDFNLVIEPQQSVALVGPSGSGKSSIILLIQRFYDVQAGEILIDGRNIREYNVRWRRASSPSVPE
jgi:ATP-binding cassette, subfamily B (MDR/TAP), member 1